MFFSRDIPKDIPKKPSIKGPLLAIVAILVAAFILILFFSFILPGSQKGVLYETENSQTWMFEKAGISLVTEITKHDNGNISWKRFVKCPDDTQIPWGAGENVTPEDFYFRFAVIKASISPEDYIVYFTREGRVERPCGCEK